MNEPYVTIGLHYSDPTGNAAARNIDRANRKKKAPSCANTTGATSTKYQTSTEGQDQ